MHQSLGEEGNWHAHAAAQIMSNFKVIWFGKVRGGSNTGTCENPRSDESTKIAHTGTSNPPSKQLYVT